MHFRDGTPRQQALFGLLIALALLGVAFGVRDKLVRVGRPSVGWITDGPYVSPMRVDAAQAGLGGGGTLIAVNGVGLAGRSLREFTGQVVRSEHGQVNVLEIRRPGGETAEVTVPVRIWTWRDAVFAQGATFTLGILFMAVGIVSFIVRPWTHGSWALLAFAAITGGLLTNIYVPVGISNLFQDVGPVDILQGCYFRAVIGLMSVVPLHVALAFPVVHPVLVRRPRTLMLLYAVGVAYAGVEILGWYTDWRGILSGLGGADTVILFLSMSVFIGRTSWLAARAGDSLVAQRARILLLGALLGGVPPLFVRFMQANFGLLTVDMRLMYLFIIFFLLALGYTTVKHDLLNARIALQRAIIYGAAVTVLTLAALIFVAIEPWTIAFLLLPLLYWWPRFTARLNDWLYPERARYPELLRAVGDELATAMSADDVLAVLARAPAHLCNTTSCTVMLFPVPGGGDGTIVSSDGQPAGVAPAELQREPLVQMLVATRRRILRDGIAVEPQYAAVQAPCLALFDRLAAEALLPLLRSEEVVGAVALGPRGSGDVYEEADLAAVTTAAQQTVQALERVQADERLRAREREFADLKRFFPPQIIDQVMARGGAAELHTQRKLVTVFFADLRGFTSFADSVEPEEVMATLEEYHAAMGRRITEFAGTLERFAGDGFMVVFNDPMEQQDHVARAVRMALAMQADMEGLRQNWSRRGYDIHAGMGVHTGYATCGFIGYEGGRQYGVIGNVTNLAARLSDHAAGGEVLISAAVHGALDGAVVTEPVGEVTLKGFHQTQQVWRVCAAPASA